ncbi:MAG: hypothetical protein H6Q71_405 [Firmicutes bacterium]|nr:hypothetical protein [Bacillota bacterium]
MRKLKWSVVAIFLLVGVIFPITAFAEYSNEPDGFRDLTWGTKFATVSSQMVFLESLPNDGRVYERPGDDLTMGQAKLTFIHYVFWRNKLAIIQIGVDNDSRVALRRELFEQYGKVELYNNCYLWGGDKTVIAFQRDNYRLLMYSRPLWEEMQQ